MRKQCFAQKCALKSDCCSGAPSGGAAWRGHRKRKRCGQQEAVHTEKRRPLAGKIVTVQSKSSGETALSEKSDLVASFKNGKYELDADYTAAFNRLSAGAVEAIVVDVGVAEYLIRDKAGYKILNEQISTETYGVGFLKGNTALRDEINAEMKKIATENPDFIKGLCKKYGVSYDAFTLGK